jgi:uncharacterized Zn finger protein
MEMERESSGVPLPPEPAAFWGEESTGEVSPGEARIPPVTAALLRRLGNFPFWRGEEGFSDALHGIYREAALVGLDVFLGERRADSAA